MSPALAEAIESFRTNHYAQRCQHPAAALGLCGHVSIAFVQHLRARGIVAQFVIMATELIPGVILVHAVVLVDGRYVDWAARQLDPASPWPALIDPWPVRRVLALDDPRVLERQTIAGQDMNKALEPTTSRAWSLIS